MNSRCHYCHLPTTRYVSGIGLVCSKACEGAERRLNRFHPPKEVRFWWEAQSKEARRPLIRSS